MGNFYRRVVKAAPGEHGCCCFTGPSKFRTSVPLAAAPNILYYPGKLLLPNWV